MSEMTEANRHLPVPSRLRVVKENTPQVVKDAARATTRGYGLLTAEARLLPEFVVMGTKRGGTTSLWNAIVRHPDVLSMFPKSREIKSPRYFTLNYDRGPRWYRSHFPTISARQAHQRRSGATPIAGEADPYYMFHPLAPHRIAADLPGAKVIVTLRNPVDRAWSHYRERVGGTTETLSFRQALEAEPERTDGEALKIMTASQNYVSFHHNYSSYLARGRYAEQLPVLMELFGDRLLVLRAEDFYRDSLGEMQKVADFLGLRPFPLIDVKRYNQMPKSSMPEADREFLIDYYRPHVAAVEQLLDRPMEWDGF